MQQQACPCHLLLPLPMPCSASAACLLCQATSHPADAWQPSPLLLCTALPVSIQAIKQQIRDGNTYLSTLQVVSKAAMVSDLTYITPLPDMHALKQQIAEGDMNSSILSLTCHI